MHSAISLICQNDDQKESYSDSTEVVRTLKVWRTYIGGSARNVNTDGHTESNHSFSLSTSTLLIVISSILNQD